ncbi:hypothetical protein DICPUDRAFT_84811 [Dictyostelium purpureum]|uniref:Uncharacterized protein n=1 Tax=Dictyostelium purpureum TaxID=5786 RepID=F1A3T5_DICPU|nr:uncharacterized protein DICPUDRAFT_84811 [Dictyostelium purpureum]EGC29147.1 hypothetical protein DICPUDRAFT_84811 [Dictyostelium purpureum]|eukprot:XP_003294328.1 hypothetical protein DICPUDRAFT_84811 [Dictyostelium purpureum]
MPQYSPYASTFAPVYRYQSRQQPKSQQTPQHTPQQQLKPTFTSQFIEGPSIEEYDEELGAPTQSYEGMVEGSSIEEFDEELGEWVTIYTSPATFAHYTPQPTSNYPTFYAPGSIFDSTGAST